MENSLQQVRLIRFVRFLPFLLALLDVALAIPIHNTVPLPANLNGAPDPLKAHHLALPQIDPNSISEPLLHNMLLTYGHLHSHRPEPTIKGIGTIKLLKEGKVAKSEELINVNMTPPPASEASQSDMQAYIDSLRAYLLSRPPASRQAFVQAYMDHADADETYALQRALGWDTVRHFRIDDQGVDEPEGGLVNVDQGSINAFKAADVIGQLEQRHMLVGSANDGNASNVTATSSMTPEEERHARQLATLIEAMSVKQLNDFLPAYLQHASAKDIQALNKAMEDYMNKQEKTSIPRAKRSTNEEGAVHIKLHGETKGKRSFDTDFVSLKKRGPVEQIEKKEGKRRPPPTLTPTPTIKGKVHPSLIKPIIPSREGRRVRDPRLRPLVFCLPCLSERPSTFSSIASSASFDTLRAPAGTSKSLSTLRDPTANDKSSALLRRSAAAPELRCCTFSESSNTAPLDVSSSAPEGTPARLRFKHAAVTKRATKESHSSTLLKKRSALSRDGFRQAYLARRSPLVISPYHIPLPSHALSSDDQRQKEAERQQTEEHHLTIADNKTDNDVELSPTAATINRTDSVSTKVTLPSEADEHVQARLSFVGKRSPTHYLMPSIPRP